MDAPEVTELSEGAAPRERELTRASAATLIAAVTSIAVGLIRSKIVALVLGPFGVGAFATLNLYLSSVTVVAGAAAGRGAVRALAEMGDRDDPTRPWLQRYLFVGPLLIGVVLAAITAAAAGPLSGLLLGEPDLGFGLVLTAVAVPVAVIAASHTHLLQALLRVGTIARADLVTTLVSLPLTAVLVIAFGLAGGIVAVGTGFAVRLLALRLLSPGVLPRGDWKRSLRIPSGVLRPILVMGSGAAILGIATTVGALLMRAQIVRTLGLDANGLYQPIVALSDTYLDVVIGATSVYLFPRLTELLTRGDRATAERELGHGLRLSLAVSVPVILVATGLSGLLIELLYSAEFADAAWPLTVQMAGTLLKVVSWSVGAALLPLGLTRAWVSIGLLVVVLRYVGVIVLTPSLGLVGAALAADTAWAIGAVATLVAVQRSRRLRVGWSDLIPVGVAGILVVVVLAARTIDEVLATLVTVAATILWLAMARRELGAVLHSLLDALPRHGRRSAG
ncbi:MAG: hypothetical protein WD830_11230 [Chloroflexota bacterium]